jgi:hypothetical protein
MNLFGKDWTRRQLEARLGRLEQLAGIRRLMLNDGPEAGVEQIEVRSGAGLACWVSPQRGLDISLAQFGGAPLSWQSPNGDVHPAYYDDRGLNWLRTAAGGLLMTCGLTQVGSPNVDQGQELGLHGRYHHTPASQVCASGQWLSENSYQMEISGVVEEGIIFGDHLRLTRTLRAWLGENRLTIHDVVENLGFAPAPHMILYHFNFGFPLLDEESEIHFPSRSVEPREPDLPMDGLDRWEAPQPGYQERVYSHHDLALDGRGWACAAIRNPHFPLANGQAPVDLTVRLSWNATSLPHLVQWKMPGAGIHVLGIEPGNCQVGGRAAERAAGRLVTLQPGQSAVYDLELAVEIAQL